MTTAAAAGIQCTVRAHSHWKAQSREFFIGIQKRSDWNTTFTFGLCRCCRTAGVAVVVATVIVVVVVAPVVVTVTVAAVTAVACYRPALGRGFTVLSLSAELSRFRKTPRRVVVGKLIALQCSYGFP